ncbi:uncharacterized protein LOC133182524 isoform X13 [Saccostrea echinata]|uniref:uncharacterized protein LOC133182524 isoform X13 n=1 Tax=Saccostrea echinata TaxID=191078 RepID=UPI002A8208F0|nr:uncharacterized protein LOC133182524 isoform X13 [Saccostrea echinata]
MAVDVLRERHPHVNFGVTRDGRIFFIDEKSRTTSWLHPLKRNPVQTGHRRVSGLPDGWEQAVTPEGAIYFIDHNTQTTTFEHPVTGRTVSHGSPKQSSTSAASPPNSPGGGPPKSPIRSPTKLRALKAPAAKREETAMVTIKGWLYRQESGGLKSWKKRWCVLADFGLFFYKDDKEHHSVGSILLPSYQISQSAPGESNKKFSFKAEHNNMKTYFFASDSQIDMERWIKSLKLAAALKGVPKKSPEPNNNTPKLIPKSAFMEWDEDEDEDVKKRFSGPPEFPPSNKSNSQSAFGPYQDQGQPRLSPEKRNTNQYPENRDPPHRRYEHFPTDPRAQVNHRPQNRQTDRARPLSEEIQPSRNYPRDNSLRPDDPQNRRSYNEPHPQERSYNEYDPRNVDPRRNTQDNRHPTYRDEVDARLGYPNRIPDYSRAAYDQEKDRENSHNQDNVYSKPVKKLNRDLSPHERFEERGGHNRTKEYRIQPSSPRHKADDNPYVHMSQHDPRSVDRPDIIPHSNHSRETSETSNYGYYSPQRAEAQQMDRLYGDERGYPQDPQILRHGRIKPEHDENYPGRSNSQHPKEPPRLYLTQDQPPVNQSSQPLQQANRENLSLPVSQNDLYVDIPHTYVNIGDALSHRNGDQISPAPHRPPLPSAVRSQYVEELAQAKTPKTSQELLDAERALEIRMQQPAYFNYPTPTSENAPHFPRGGNNYQGNHLHPGYVGYPHQNEAGHGNQNGYKSNFGGRKGGKKPGMIHTVKEDPDMPDSQVIATAGLPGLNKKYPIGGSRIRMSISAGDLLGKTHDELVLMLIQLRRDQAAEENVRHFLRQRLEEKRHAEHRYRQIVQQSGGPVDAHLEEEHNEYTRLKYQLIEVEKGLEVYRPLVNLVHNMVNMGSLYGGDNYMMATQYRKHLLSPEEYTPPKKMIEFSRKHQEEEMVQSMKEEIRQLNQDEADLEEKLERLYELDRLLQEQSYKVISYQEDKELLEKALHGILRQQDMSRDNPRDLDNLLHQQRTIEKELSRVMHYLAEASKELEETTAENNKVEHEVALLRSKVHGDLNRSKSAPSLSEENYKNKVKMEKDLARVQDMMVGLTEQQAELSEAMKRFRRLSSGGGMENMLEKPEKESPKTNKNKSVEKLPSTYMETDLDTGDSKDLSQVQQVLHSYNSLPRGGYSQNTSPTDVGRYETLVSQNNVSLESSSLSPGGGPMENSDGQWDISEADDNTKRFFGIIPKEKPKVLTVRDVKRQSELRKENHKTRREDVSPDPSWTYDGQGVQSEEQPTSGSHGNHPVYENLPPVNSSKPWSSVLPSNPSSAPSSRRSSSLHLMGPRPFVPFHLQSNTPSPVTHVESPVTVTTNSSSFHQPQTDGVVKATRIIVQPPFNDNETNSDNGTAPVSTHSSTGMFNVKRTPKGRYMTISSSEPVKLETSFIQPTSPNTAAGDLMTNRMDMVPDIVKSSQKAPHQLDEAAIEREILYVPNKVEIPERYIPDSDDESITEEEKIKREEKAEKIKRLLTKSSVQHSLSQPDVSQVGEIHQQAKEQKIKTAHLLAVSQELAKQVTLKSRQAAVERAKRRKTWSGSPSKVTGPVLDPEDLEVGQTLGSSENLSMYHRRQGSSEFIAPHHRRQENMYM